jgi:hypothetical protein
VRVAAVSCLCALALSAPASTTSSPTTPALFGSQSGVKTEIYKKAEYRLLKLDGPDVSWYVPASLTNAPPITYAFVKEPQVVPHARNCGAMLAPTHALKPSGIAEPEFRREVRAAFAMWADVAAIEFREVDDPETAGIVIGAQAKPRGRAFTNVATQSPGSPAIAQSLICLNPEKRWKIGFDGNLDVYDIRYTMAHEIGHAIGLDHPGREGQLMSYRYGETSRELTPGDVAGAVAIYGPRGFPAFARRTSPAREAMLGREETSRGLDEPASR